MLREHGLIERIDFRGDAADDRVRYAVPDLPAGAHLKRRCLRQRAFG